MKNIAREIATAWLIAAATRYNGTLNHRLEEMQKNANDNDLDADFDLDSIIPLESAFSFISELDGLWRGKLTVAELYEVDQKSIAQIALRAIGRGGLIEHDSETAAFLRSKGVTSAVPQRSEDSIEDEILKALDFFEKDMKGRNVGGNLSR